MVLRERLVAACLSALATMTPYQEATRIPAVVLSRIQISYPPIAESAMVSGKVSVRVGVRPDGSVVETTLLQGEPLLNSAAIDAAARASFECPDCSEPSTPHVITFVFSFDGLDSAGQLLPTAWKQTGDATSEVRVFGTVPTINVGPPPKPFHVRAARCLWLWHCSKQAYVTPIM